jgi:hypothetical protein
MKTQLGLHMIRRSHEQGHHYFIANLSPEDVDASVPLAVDFASAMWYDPMTGDTTPAEIAGRNIRIRLRSGESRILKTNNMPMDSHAEHVVVPPSSTEEITLQGPWTLTFVDAQPEVTETFQLDTPQTWEGLSPAAAVTMGTGVYTTTLRLTRRQARQHWMLDLGDVRESARVYINGQFIGCAWAVPFVLDCRDALRKGKNEIRIEVTNLPANRIADLDRQGYKWREFNEINVVQLNDQRTT